MYTYIYTYRYIYIYIYICMNIYMCIYIRDADSDSGRQSGGSWSQILPPGGRFEYLANRIWIPEADFMSCQTDPSSGRQILPEAGRLSLNADSSSGMQIWGSVEQFLPLCRSEFLGGRFWLTKLEVRFWLRGSDLMLWNAESGKTEKETIQPPFLCWGVGSWPSGARQPMMYGGTLRFCTAPSHPSGIASWMRREKCARIVVGRWCRAFYGRWCRAFYGRLLAPNTCWHLTPVVVWAGVAAEAVDIAFEQCYADTAPFDRSP